MEKLTVVEPKLNNSKPITKEEILKEMEEEIGATEN